MSFQDAAVLLLLIVGVATVAVSSVGLLVNDDVFDRIHYLGPAGTLAPVVFAVAVLMDQGFTGVTLKAWIAAALIVLTGPAVAHATGRAARIRQFDHMAPLPAEEVDPD